MWLSTIRGLAALLVFASHLTLAWTYNTHFIIGRIGVVLFFLLSGYLTYQSRIKRDRKQYLFNRFVRMYPIYWLLVIISWFVFSNEELSILQLLANLTAFHEFLGFENIIGASWMLPIQISFFVLIAVIEIKVFDENIRIARLGFIGIGLLAIASGVLRYTTGKPFPTAFMLLILVGIIGILMFMHDSNMVERKQVISFVIIFEVTLLISAILSYVNWWAYLAAYNIGILIFVLAMKIKKHIVIFDRLGGIGFTFFLGADIIYTILIKVGLCGQGEYMTAADILVKFITAMILAIVVTGFIERPLLKWAGKIEKQI